MKPRITLITRGVDATTWRRHPADQDAAQRYEVSLGHNVGSQAEVDAVMAQAKRAGARIVKRAATTFWGGCAVHFLGADRYAK
jgi:uncharacterized glyoxalase superfamily protein PhnB